MTETKAPGFWLYVLKVETVAGDRHAACRHVEGEALVSRPVGTFR